MNFANLHSLIQPREIVMFGVTERPGSHGRSTYENIALLSDFDADKIHLVHPNKDQMFGKTCYKSVKDIGSDKIDVAVIMVRAELVPDIVKECDECNIPFALVMSSGFAETGEKGRDVQERLMRVLENGKIRLYGPNSPGLTDINRRLGMTFSPAFKYDTLGGSVGLVCQGGGIGRSILQGMSRGVGFGYFVSVGNEVDLDLCDFIHHLIQDPAIKVISVVAEGFKDGRRFIEVAKSALAAGKPIVIMKVGRSESGRKAVMSHTGKMAGSDKVFDAVCRQYNIIRVNDVDELLETSALFARFGIRSSNRIAIVTSSGGSGSHTADLIGAAGLELTQLTPRTIESLEEITPPFASLKNPIDLTATVLEDRTLHTKCMEIIAQDENVDIIVVPIASSYGQNTEIRCQDIVEVQKNTNTMIVTIWMSSMVEGGHDILVQGGMVPYRSVRNMVASLKQYTKYAERLRSESTAGREDDGAFERLQLELPEHTPVLNELDSKRVLETIGIRTPKETLAADEAEALRAAEEIGYPVALKGVSKDIPHKTEAGVVKLGIGNSERLRAAYKEIINNAQRYNPDARIDGILVSEMVVGGTEMIVGVKADPQFGPIVLVGMGGIYTEVLNDVRIGVCPVDYAYARQLIDDLQTAPLLQGFRGMPKRDVHDLALVIERLSGLAVAMQDKIAEIDINPLFVLNDGNGAIAVDALIITNSQ